MPNTYERSGGNGPIMHIEVERTKQEDKSQVGLGNNFYRGNRSKTHGKGSLVTSSPASQLFNKNFKSPISFKNDGTTTGSTESGLGPYNLMSSKQY